MRKISACKMTYRAVFNVNFGAETFECLTNLVYIGLKEVSQPAF